MVYVDIDAQHVQEFNKWYNEEHLPELLSVPGILSAARYEAVKGGPQYLACYELESVAVMKTPAFTSRPRTPWGKKDSPSGLGKKCDWVGGEKVVRGGGEGAEGGWARVVEVGPLPPPRGGGGGGERLVGGEICACLPKGAGSNPPPPLSRSRGYQRVQHGLR